MFEKVFEKIGKKLDELKVLNLYRSIRDPEACEGMKIFIDGKKLINFASNDYLGLKNHPVVKQAAKQAVEIFGVGTGASRLLCGGSRFHKELENLLCEFKGSEAALVLNSGYTANISLIPALTKEEDVIFSDELNHASLIDGCRLSKAKKVIYRHNDMEHLKNLIKETPCNGQRIIITDTVFSMDGDLAPIRELYEICISEEAILYLDDAHGTGVLGNGHGALQHFGLKADNFIIQMGTLSKALGSFGAFVCADKRFVEWFINNARGFIFSTGLPASVVASAIASIKLIIKERTLIERLWENTHKVITVLKDLQLKTTATETPIIPILFESIEEATKASKILYDSGTYAPVIRPPTVKTPRIRITVSAGHSDEDIDTLKKALIRLCQQLRQV